MKILLAVDGSETSDAAVAAIARGPLPTGTEVHILSVAEPPHFPETFSGGSGSVIPYDAIERAAHERALAAVTRAADELAANRLGLALTVTTEVAAGNPKRVILERADTIDADLIVVGSHGHGLLDRFVLGSVSQAVALHASCSVEIVRTRITHSTSQK